MRIFIDTANVEEIREAYSWGVIEGVTTNPSLVASCGGDFQCTIKEIISIVDGPISVEVVSLKSEEMIEEARKLAAWSPNVVIKIPMTEEGMKAVKVLSKEEIKTNVTLVFSANQALLAAQAGAAYVSIFVGRLDDIGHSGIEVVRECVDIFNYYEFDSEIISASIRHPQHVLESALSGAPIATIPYKVLKQMFAHPLTDIGIKRFLEDWKKVKKEN